MVDHFFRLEMEDMELKHNSALKQLMREFNTQMALKEKELEGSVKETIGKKNMYLISKSISNYFQALLGVGDIPVDKIIR